MAALLTLSTQRAYYLDTYQNTFESSISRIKVGADNIGLIFERTIFHPKGGGQPDDIGSIEIEGIHYPIIGLVESTEENREARSITHHIKRVEGVNVQVGQKVKMTIDLSKRLLFARLHTAGHLLANVVESIDVRLDGYGGHHVPGEARVVFKRKAGVEGVELKASAAAPAAPTAPAPKKGKKGSEKPKEAALLNKEDIERRINGLIKEARAVVTNNSSQPRTVQIDGLKAYPCGGTHLKNIAEIGVFTVRRIEDKKGEVRIGYDITDSVTPLDEATVAE